MPRANIAWEARLASMKLLRDAYAAFNARDIDAALGTMHPDVVWPNGVEGGYVHGHDAVRAYWTRQWDVIDPHVEPRRFTTVEPGRVVVDVHQVVRDRARTIVTDQMVQHVYVIEDGVIRRMEIRTPTPRTSSAGRRRGSRPRAASARGARGWRRG